VRIRTLLLGWEQNTAVRTLTTAATDQSARAAVPFVAQRHVASALASRILSSTRILAEHHVAGTAGFRADDAAHVAAHLTRRTGHAAAGLSVSGAVIARAGPRVQAIAANRNLTAATTAIGASE
jgi:hypothetical protein